MTDREIQNLWELFECAQRDYGDRMAHLLLKISMQSALLDGVRQSMTNPGEGHSPTAILEPAQLNIDLNIERWWGSIGISRRYADPPLAFYCFEKALEIVYQKGLHLVNDRKMKNTDNGDTR